MAATAPFAKPVLESATGIHHAPTGRDPFNRTQADTTKGFVGILRHNAVLLARYSRHFGVKGSAIVEYVQNALVPYKLPSARTMTTFGVSRTGEIYPVTDHLKAGTRVWATRDGVPVFKWTCSNPLAYNLPGEKLAEKLSKKRSRVAVGPTNTKAPASQGAALAPMDDADVLGSRVAVGPVSELVQPDFPVLPITGQIADITGAPTVANAGDPGLDPGLTPVPAAKKYGGIFLLPLSLGAGAILDASALNGGSAGGTVKHTVVPENNSVGLVLAGGVVLALSLARRRRQASA